MGRRQSVLPRRLHQWWADTFHYFWLPCPLCGAWSGGHEWKDRRGFPSSICQPERGRGQGICPACTREGRGCEWWFVLRERCVTCQHWDQHDRAGIGVCGHYGCGCDGPVT